MEEVPGFPEIWIEAQNRYWIYCMHPGTWAQYQKIPDNLIGCATSSHVEEGDVVILYVTGRHGGVVGVLQLDLKLMVVSEEDRKKLTLYPDRNKSAYYSQHDFRTLFSQPIPFSRITAPHEAHGYKSLRSFTTKCLRGDAVFHEVDRFYAVVILGEISALTMEVADLADLPPEPKKKKAPTKKASTKKAPTKKASQKTAPPPTPLISSSSPEISLTRSSRTRHSASRTRPTTSSSSSSRPITRAGHRPRLSRFQESDSDSEESLPDWTPISIPSVVGSPRIGDDNLFGPPPNLHPRSNLKIEGESEDEWEDKPGGYLEDEPGGYLGDNLFGPPPNLDPRPNLKIEGESEDEWEAPRSDPLMNIQIVEESDEEDIFGPPPNLDPRPEIKIADTSSSPNRDIWVPSTRTSPSDAESDSPPARKARTRSRKAKTGRKSKHQPSNHPSNHPSHHQSSDPSDSNPDSDSEVTPLILASSSTPESKPRRRIPRKKSIRESTPQTSGPPVKKSSKTQVKKKVRVSAQKKAPARRRRKKTPPPAKGKKQETYPALMESDEEWEFVEYIPVLLDPRLEFAYPTTSASLKKFLLQHLNNGGFDITNNNEGEISLLIQQAQLEIIQDRDGEEDSSVSPAERVLDAYHGMDPYDPDYTRHLSRIKRQLRKKEKERDEARPKQRRQRMHQEMKEWLKEEKQRPIVQVHLIEKHDIYAGCLLITLAVCQEK